MKNKIKRNRSTWFKAYKGILRCFFKRPKFIYLGDEFQTKSIILSNHVGMFSPLMMELHQRKLIRFWGIHKMKEGLISSYKYLSTTYFHEKKGMGKNISKIIAFIACPFTNLFYKGLRLIPTYENIRFRSTIKESIKAIEDNQNIVIFPENSSSGYFDELKEFHSGFYLFLQNAYKKGIDLPIYVAYFQKKTNKYIFDKKIMFSDLLKLNLSKEEIAKKLCSRCNELGKMNIEG